MNKIFDKTIWNINNSSKPERTPFQKKWDELATPGWEKFIKSLENNIKKEFHMDRKFRKKPVIIEAIQFDGENRQDIIAWMLSSAENAARNLYLNPTDDDNELSITTLEGVMHVSENDWVIKGVKGEFYPCKPDIFEATYEEVFQHEHE